MTEARTVDPLVHSEYAAPIGRERERTMAIDLDRAPEILRRIADALGVPMDSLFADPGAVTDAKGQAAECLRLWSRLRTDEQRRRALAALQALVDESGPQR